MVIDYCLKLFVFFGFVIIHIHSEIMLECFSKIKDISVVIINTLIY